MKIVDKRIAKICTAVMGQTTPKLFLVPPDAMGNDFGSVAVDMAKVKRIPASDAASYTGLRLPDGYRVAYDNTLDATTTGSTFSDTTCVNFGDESDPTAVKLSAPLHAGDAVSILFN